MNDNRTAFFSRLVDGEISAGEGETDIRAGGKILVMSDFHMGGGRGGDLERNGALVTAILENYYNERGFILVLNGDIEELLKYSLSSIEKRWESLYRVFSKFYDAGRLYKILGNHDAELVLEKNYPYQLYETLTIKTDCCPVFVYHGHQASHIYSKYPRLIAALVRYTLKPLGIGNITSARNPRKRFAAEKRAYEFSLKNGVFSIIGHTHRALFESYGRFEYIKYEIERLCREYPTLTGENCAAEKERIKNEVAALKADLCKLGSKEKRGILRPSLYGGDIPVPCLFNAGSVIGKKGITAIELDNDSVSLVYWWEEGKGKRFVERGAYKQEELPASISNGGLIRKAVLNEEKLSYIKARMEILAA